MVDGNAVIRRIVESTMTKHGYKVLQADDGRQAVELFVQHRPDIVLMDISMPNVNAYEAVREIKALCRNEFVPILILTASQDPEIMARCIEAGGDEILSTPFHPLLLGAKLTAMARIRDLHRTLNGLYQQTQHAEILAESVFSQAVTARNALGTNLQTYSRGLSTFSGDVLLSEHTPTGDLNLLLGDFTGHGLAAALGALPAGEVFRAMSEKGFTPEQILEGINRKLFHLLPTGMFMAVQFVQIEQDLNHVRVINHGMPDLLIVDDHSRRIRHNVASGGLPLGITPKIDFGPASRRYPVTRHDRVILYSDGLTEARNRAGEIFGEMRLNHAIQSAPIDQALVPFVVEALENFRDQAEQTDDISLVDLPCDETVVRQQLVQASLAGDPNIDETPYEDWISDWDFSVTLRGPSLRNADIVPRIFSQLQDSVHIEQHRKALFTILTELFVNALDHGVLKLDSALKSDAEGFQRYFIEREQRLAKLDSGWVRIDLGIHRSADHGRIVIGIEDSGDGFDHRQRSAADDGALSGRGLQLIRSLASQLTIAEPGNRMTVIYRWSS